MIKAHFVTFHSPGTMCSEESTQPIESWDIHKAMEMARGIKERHGATPYGFVFTTRSRGEYELDSKETDRSVFYYLGGTVRTLEEVKTANRPDEKILLWNMENNGYKRVLENGNSYKWTTPLKDTDVVLDFRR